MNDRRKTKAQLLDELAGLRQQVADLQYRLTDQHPDRPLPLNRPLAMCTPLNQNPRVIFASEHSLKTHPALSRYWASMAG